MTIERVGALAPAPALSLDDRGLLIWSALGVVVSGIFPQATPGVVVLSMLAPLVRADRSGMAAGSWRPGAVITLLLVILVYLCLNVALARATSNAGMAITAIALGTLAIHVCGVTLPTLQTRHLQLMARGAIYGFLIAICFLFIEYVTRMSLQRSLEHALAAANINVLSVQTGTWEQPFIWGMSRNLIVMVMLLWGICAFVSLCMPARRRSPWIGTFVVLTGACVLLSPSGTAKLGFIAGGIAWGIARSAPDLARASMTFVWTALTLGIVPIAQLIHKFRLYDLTWLPGSGRHRMMIWSASAEWFWHKPLTGLGIGGARTVNLNQGVNISTDGLGAVPLEWHAHNSYVQAWLEAGAVGGLLLFALGLSIILAIEKAPSALRPVAYATFASITFIGLTGFSLWAPWYLCAYALAAVFVLHALVLSQRGDGLLPSTSR